ncbi:DinB family protein [Saccharomonospora piscinae]|uniref:DinB family protein n=1 Tax=Saccharomonospora piscinae TaxID=687388 RepID=UPI0004AC7975|nr:DinB family protein [Saccharomonospora piscinae]
MTTDRTMPPPTADERTMLESWLDFYRATLALRCDGLSGDQLRTAAVPPSPLTLQGLVQHAAEVERNWFHRVLLGEDVPPLFAPREADGNDDGFDVSGDLAFDDALATWKAEVAAARERCAGLSLDETRSVPFGAVSVRWIYQHMIAEYARHCGHADLIRERIDGTTGV